MALRTAADEGALVPRSGKTYEVLETLARGGMGEVLVARERASTLFDRLVVLKAPLAHLCDDDDFITAFLDEARLGAQLKHPNVAQIHDVVELEGRPCIVMELLRGLDVRSILRRSLEAGRAIEVEVAVAILEGIASALAYAHDAKDERGRPLGVVHRDVSPHNAIVTRDGLVKLIDFGIARSANRLTKTATGLVKGKIAYMAPEQLLGRGVDRRADLWALGVVFWECLTGQKLFAAGTAEGVMAAAMNDPIAPPSSVNRAVDAELDAIVMHLLERDPARRFQTAGALLSELRAWGRGRQVPDADGLATWLEALAPSSEDVDFARKPATRTITLSPPTFRRSDTGDATADLRRPGPTGGRSATDERTTTRTIDEHIVELDPSASPSTPPPAGRTETLEPPVARAALGEPRGAVVETESGRRGVGLWLALGGAVLVGVAVVSFVVARGSGSENAEAAPAAAPAPPSVPDVVIELTGIPETATVLLDGRLEPARRLTLHASDVVHHLQVRTAEGQLHDRDLVADRDQRIHFVLTPASTAPPATETATRAPDGTMRRSRTPTNPIEPREPPPTIEEPTPMQRGTLGMQLDVEGYDG